MADIRIDLEAPATSEQAAFVENAVRNSFRVTAFDWTEEAVIIAHQETGAADAMAAMAHWLV